jgi:hypothetical protein
MLENQPAPKTTLNLAADDRWLTAQEIVDSPQFCRSPRLSRLLLYLSEQTLLERTDLLTEHHIAVRVFERGSDFNPGVDTIVRSHMVRLRQKLIQYATDNPSPIRVAAPKGEYLVRFERIAPPTPKEKVAVFPTPDAPRIAPVRRRLHPLAWGCGLLGLTALLLLAALMLVLERAQGATELREAAVHPLWSHFFQPDQVTTFVAADSGLVLLHGMTEKSSTLAEYLRRDFSQETRGLPRARIDEVLGMANRRYTSFVDLNMYRRLQQLPISSSGKLAVKYARDIQMDELKQGNVILSGSRGANPWLELYEPGLNFIGLNDEIHHTYSFINRHPRVDEAARYSVSAADPKERVLGVLAFLPNLDGNGNALIVEGNSMAGTEAISDFLFDDASLLPFLAKLKRPDGSLPHFEVLLESNSVNGSAGPFHLLAYRTHP